jgi:hypothetical protein
LGEGLALEERGGGGDPRRVASQLGHPGDNLRVIDKLGSKREGKRAAHVRVHGEHGNSGRCEVNAGLILGHLEHSRVWLLVDKALEVSGDGGTLARPNHTHGSTCSLQEEVCVVCIRPVSELPHLTLLGRVQRARASAGELSIKVNLKAAERRGDREGGTHMPVEEGLYECVPVRVVEENAGDSWVAFRDPPDLSNLGVVGHEELVAVTLCLPTDDIRLEDIGRKEARDRGHGRCQGEEEHEHAHGLGG